jgi:signal peptidase II
MNKTQKLWSFVLILFFLVLDQWTKWLASTHLVNGQPLVLTSFFNLTLAHNTGAAFSLFRNADGSISFLARWFLVALACGVSLILAWWLFIRKTAVDHQKAISFSLIIAGALGNVIDRVRLGYVVDFFDLHVGLWHWPVFNIADCAVVVGVFLLAFLPEKK